MIRFHFNKNINHNICSKPYIRITTRHRFTGLKNDNQELQSSRMNIEKKINSQKIHQQLCHLFEALEEHRKQQMDYKTNDQIFDQRNSFIHQCNEIMKSIFGFRLFLAPSSIQGAGTGVYLSGQASCGDVLGIYPGTVYESHEPLILPSIRNSFILQRKDAVMVDGKDHGISSRVFRSCSRRERLMFGDDLLDHDQNQDFFITSNENDSFSYQHRQLEKTLMSDESWLNYRKFSQAIIDSNPDEKYSMAKFFSLFFSSKNRSKTNEEKFSISDAMYRNNHELFYEWQQRFDTFLCEQLENDSNRNDLQSSKRFFHPAALGHYINAFNDHSGENTPNAMYLEHDFIISHNFNIDNNSNNNEKENYISDNPVTGISPWMRRYIPNVPYRYDFMSPNVETLDRIKSVVLIALKDIENEELFTSYYNEVE